MILPNSARIPGFGSRILEGDEDRSFINFGLCVEFDQIEHSNRH